MTLALPGMAAGKVTEVGLIESTTPETVPSCTAGPIGSFGKQLEKEKKEAEKKEAEKKKRKSPTGHKSGARRRHHARRHARLAATGTKTEQTAPSTKTEQTATNTKPTEEAEGTGTSEVKTEAPCLAVSRTTGIQSKVGQVGHPLVVPANGRIVAWTIELGRPTATQIKFFDENEGGAPSAAISVLSPVKTKNRTTPTYHLLAQSSVVNLEPYFGMTVQLPLTTTLKVKKGDVIALTVPTWAPALALGFGKNTSWRASRQQGQCSTTSSQTAQTELKSNVSYFCMYQTARLTFSATLISTP